MEGWKEVKKEGGKEGGREGWKDGMGQYGRGGEER